MRRIRLVLAVTAALVLLPVCAFYTLDAVFPFPVERLRPEAATVVADRNGAALRMFLPADETWRFPVAAVDVSPVFVKTLLASEDRFFYDHPGVNPFSIVRAAYSNLRAGRVVSGASTITMQLARLAEPKPRTLAGKCLEAFRALQLERLYDKDELLEFYLNLAPYGGNIVGVGAASYFYFNKTPDKLSLGDAALLTALPRSPVRYDPVRRPGAARRARNRVLDLLAAQGAVTAADAKQAAGRPLPRQRTKPPFAAPHFCRMARSLVGPKPVIRTTLDKDMQSAVDRAVSGRIRELKNRGIGNAAVVVLDTVSRDILAMAGSAGFFDDKELGQINGALIRRSPGSTLKPLLYAQAFDLGLLVPESILLDIPTAFAGYAPKNYDGLFRGPVTAEQALASSLNVPAVRLLKRVGAARFHNLLLRGGVDTLDKPASHYGLALALGSGEVTLLTLTNLYAALASGGRLAQPQFLVKKIRAAPARAPLFSPEACALTMDILAKVPRPDLTRDGEAAADALPVAWKTGTSFGHRDAWAVGCCAGLAVGVWVGNMDGRAVKGISGAEHAGPLLFDILRVLTASRSRPPADQRPDIGEIEVCAVSRKLPGPHCKHRIRVKYIPGRSHFTACDAHKQILVDAKTGLRLYGQCLNGRPGGDIATRVVTDYPADLTAWRRSVGVPVETPPPPSPDCAEVAGGQGPRIVSPSPDAHYRLLKNTPAEFQRIALAATAPADADMLYWFEDGRLAAQGPPGEKRFLDPRPGRRRLVVVDNLGRMDAVAFRVEELSSSQ